MEWQAFGERPSEAMESDGLSPVLVKYTRAGVYFSEHILIFTEHSSETSWVAIVNLLLTSDNTSGTEGDANL